MPKETIKTRDGELTLGWDAHQAQISIDLGKPFIFSDYDLGDDEYTDLYFSLDLESIELLQKHLARVKRYLKKTS
jgi:hypothetical protein